MFKNLLSWKIMYATAHWLGLKPMLLSNLWASKHLKIHTCRSEKSTFSCPPQPPRNLYFWDLCIYKNLRTALSGAIRLIINAPYRTHHCELYSLLNRTSLETHWHICIYQVLLGLLPEYLHKLLNPHSNTYRSSNYIYLAIPRKKTTYGRPAFECAAPNDSICFKKLLKLETNIKKVDKYYSVCI